MKGTSNDRSRGGAGAWIVRSLVVAVAATLIVATRRSRSRRREHMEHMSWSSEAPAPVSNTPTATGPRTTDQRVAADRASDDAHLDPESPERDVLEQRQEAAPEPVDGFPGAIPPEQPEADVLEQWREVSVEEEPQVVDEPPRDR